MYQQLIATPSISSMDPGWDHSNKGVIEKLRKSFVQIVELGVKDSISQTEENINTVAKAFGKEKEGEKLKA
ncbi:MAG: hypothetical protein HRT70_09850 [Flavobacteriaceae bacterium]|nr:hypothetical protein [Flavobacteriaceae bacterium]